MSHFYSKQGTPEHFQKKKDGSGMRPTTIRDCKSKNLLPSVTTVIKCLDKPALNQWMINQAVYAVCTAPDLPNETIDAKIDRVLNVERQQDQESEIARDLGTEIHDAICKAIQGQSTSQLDVYAAPVIEALKQFGRPIFSEKILVGDGYAGMCDYGAEDDQWITLCDFKSCKDVPKYGAYWEHKLQLSAYAKALGNTGEKMIRTANIYISKNSPGTVKVCVNDDVAVAQKAFVALLQYWQLANNIGGPEKPLPF